MKWCFSFFLEFIHQKSPNICYLQVKGSATPLSLANCTFQIECSECDDFVYDGRFLNILHVYSVSQNEEIKGACRKCHTKMIFKFEGITFRDQGALLKDSSATGKPIKQQKLFGLVIGQNLPANGTCRHYKKSHRWLRFPCCGKGKRGV